MSRPAEERCGSDAYWEAAQQRAPAFSTRGSTNENPKDIGFWALVAEDFRTHERRFFEQGFWALFVHRFGNWRMDQPKILRAPATLLYRMLFKLVEMLSGISLWYTTRVGRRVRIWHHSGMVLGARAIGNDVHIRQNVTLGVAQTFRNNELPIIDDGVDIGAGACIVGAVLIGRNARIGGNALVLSDVPAGATMIGNPAQVYAMAAPETAEPEAEASSLIAPDADPEPVPAGPEPMLATPRDLGRIALLGSSNLDVLAANFTALEGRFGLKIQPLVPEFGQARMALLSDDSPLSQMADAPATAFATLIVERAEDVLADIATAPLSLSPEDADAYLDEALTPMLQMLEGARSRLPGPIFVTRLAAFTRPALGLADAHSDRGMTALIARANDRLARAAKDLADVHLLDTDTMLAEVGRANADAGTFWHMGRVPFSDRFGDHLAARVAGGILSLRGQTARLVVLDLDNTLWGGVLGEDGIEGLEIGGAYPGSAYQAFQAVLQALTQRGIALAVASKNDEDLALQMIDSHPEMALRSTDIIAHRINWSEKAVGIREMLDEVGLGEASCLFIDDNPVERAKVRKNLPQAIVPPFPDRPEDLAGWILSNPFLECLDLTDSDLTRTRQYKVRAKITSEKRSFQNVEDFYADLDMHLVFEPYGPANQKRVLQLFVKTNQFNCTARRHDAGSVARIIDEGGEVYAVGVQDRYSAYELMGVLVLRPGDAMRAAYPDDAAVQAQARKGDLWVDNLLLSCRILGRTIETAIVAWATDRAKAVGAQRLVGQIIETPRNTPARTVFGKAGMTAAADQPGLYVHNLSDGALTVPAYFTLGDTAPAGSRPPEDLPASAARPRSPRRPPEIQPLPQPSKQAAPRTGAGLSAETGARLDRIFLGLFGAGQPIDLDRASMDNVPRWDSLGQLRLAMAIEQDLGIRLPATQLGQLRSYAALRAAVAGQARN